MSTELVMPSNHLILCHPLLLLPSIFPNIRVFSNEPALPIKWPKYWSFSFNISPSNEHPGLISLRMDWLDLLAVQGTLESSPTPQFKSINSSALSFLYSPTLNSLCKGHHTWPLQILFRTLKFIVNYKKWTKNSKNIISLIRSYFKTLVTLKSFFIFCKKKLIKGSLNDVCLHYLIHSRHWVKNFPKSQPIIILFLNLGQLPALTLVFQCCAVSL